MGKAWDAYRSGDVPEVLDKQTTRDVNALAAAVAARKPAPAHQAALRVAQDGLDLALPYQPVVTTDLARLDLWARQLRIDLTAAARTAPGLLATVAALQSG